MTRNPDAPAPPPRAPRAFKIEDLPEEPLSPPAGAAAPAGSRRGGNAPLRPLTARDLERGFNWGSLMLSAMMALASLAFGLWFTRFVSVALERQDWLGWLAFGLMALIAVSLSALVVRELWGFRRLARLSRLRRDIAAARANGSVDAERAAVHDLMRHYGGRADMAWGLARVADHSGDVLAPGDLMKLADRELLRPVDQEARRVILKSAKRVATVTAMSPMMSIAMIFVAFENIGMFRTLSGLYGGRPGVLGALRLGRLVVGHIIATGGVAMTDDLLGQFLGQDLLRRLSRRLGEGAFNGALTARLGVAAVEVTRPLPFLDSEPLRVREIFAELVRSLRGMKEAATADANTDTTKPDTRGA